MRFRRALCVYNPVAGDGSGGDQIRQVQNELLREVDEVRIVATRFPHHAAELARMAAEEGFDLLAVQGGDGTVNDLVQGLAGHDSPMLLVLPGGTANVLAHEVGLPFDPITVVRRLPGLVPRRVLLGLVEFDDGQRRHFLLMCGAGLDAAIAARTPTRLKHRFGVGAFWLKGAEQVLRQFPVLQEAGTNGTSGTLGPSSLVIVSRSRAYGGGLVLTPRANLLSDRFEVASFQGTGRMSYVGYLLAGLFNLTGWWPGIRHRRRAKTRIEPVGREPVQIQVDGEVAGVLPANISLGPRAVRILLPSGYGAAPQTLEVDRCRQAAGAA